MAITDPLLAVAGIETMYGRSQALFGVTLELRSGEVVTLCKLCACADSGKERSLN